MSIHKPFVIVCTTPSDYKPNLIHNTLKIAGTLLSNSTSEFDIITHNQPEDCYDITELYKHSNHKPYLIVHSYRNTNVWRECLNGYPHTIIAIHTNTETYPFKIELYTPEFTKIGGCPYDDIHNPKKLETHIAHIIENLHIPNQYSNK